MPKSLIILNTIPHPETGDEWLVQYVEGDVRTEKSLPTFKDVVRYVSELYGQKTIEGEQ